MRAAGGRSIEEILREEAHDLAATQREAAPVGREV
jgi:hypothetical protein